MSMRVRALSVVPLTRAAFAAFGEVIEVDPGRAHHAVNDGTAIRYDDLANVDTASQGGHPVLSIFRAQPRRLPFDVTLLESHPLGSQAFVPLHPETAYLVVVASEPSAQPRAFLARRGQGVNYHRGTWHHPLITLDRISDFLVVDRAGDGHNCDEVQLDTHWRIERAG